MPSAGPASTRGSSSRRGRRPTRTRSFSFDGSRTVADGSEVSRLYGKVIVSRPRFHRPGHSARRPSASVAHIGRLNRRLRMAWTTSTRRDRGPSTSPAISRAIQPATATMPPDRNMLHDGSRTRASPAGSVQRRMERSRLRGGSIMTLQSFCHGRRPVMPAGSSGLAGAHAAADGVRSTLTLRRTAATVSLGSAPHRRLAPAPIQALHLIGEDDAGDTESTRDANLEGCGSSS